MNVPIAPVADTGVAGALGQSISRALLTCTNSLGTASVAVVHRMSWSISA
jgi:hypothetical protein